MTAEAKDSLFLSRLILDPRSRRVRNELGRPYEMHRTLMRAFPPVHGGDMEGARREYGMLFRADVDERDNRVIVYVQSRVEPEWSFLVAQGDYLLSNADPPNPACKNVHEVYRRLWSGQVLSFRLRANPTKRVGKSANGNEELKGKRVGLKSEEEQIAWLIRKGREREKGVIGGFEILMGEVGDAAGEVLSVPRLDVRCEGTQTGLKQEEGRSHTMTHLAVRYEGLLEVTNAEAFRRTLAAGIGSGKAFGFGLLSVAPART